ncbi:hypothetical protein HGM15179_017547 [Zosterops borbonicus]|uniref:Uncharacterized protein n=1 Tax=Zosterops borbonicus TaxID=364589 RepID=A0A8K1LD74_9PASS|nr:hypothetical protein HGM15179_017547 [Zosterops borbonicus]
MEKIRVAKPQIELGLPELWGTIKRDFLNKIKAVGSAKNTIGPFQDEDGHLADRDRNKAEVLNAAFASSFETDGPRGSQCSELEDHDCENDKLLVNPSLLLQLDPYKSTGADGIHPRILKQLLLSSQSIS